MDPSQLSRWHATHMLLSDSYQIGIHHTVEHSRYPIRIWATPARKKRNLRQFSMMGEGKRCVAFVLWNGTNLEKVNERFTSYVCFGKLEEKVLCWVKLRKRELERKRVRFGGAAYQIWKEERQNKIGIKQERENQPNRQDSNMRKDGQLILLSCPFHVFVILNFFFFYSLLRFLLS